MPDVFYGTPNKLPERRCGNQGSIRISDCRSISKFWKLPKSWRVGLAPGIRLDYNTGMTRILRLQWIVLSVWLAWLAMGALIPVTYFLHVLHPQGFLFVSFLVIQIIGSAAVAAVGAAQFARWRTPLRTVAWILLGIAPLLFDITVLSFAFRVSEMRAVEPRLLSVGRIASVAAAAMADVEARFRYQNRFAGRHVVMWCDRIDEARADVEAMDRHIDRMEAVLNRECTSKVHWIRGPLLDQEPCYFHGICIGSLPGAVLENGIELPREDLHEAAHFVIEHLCSSIPEPPSILVEGWAEAQSGHEPGAMAGLAWRRKQDHCAFSLEELVSPKWYSRSQLPVYEQGGPLVDFILRAYGGQRFFELYSTCRMETFADDCRRVLGVSLDELDQAYWDDIKRQVTSPDFKKGRDPLWTAKLDEGVDRAAWDEIVVQHAKSLERARDALRHSRFIVRSERVNQASAGTPEKDLEFVEFAGNGPSARLSVQWRPERDPGAIVVVAAPQMTFWLTKHENVDRWEAARFWGAGNPRSDMALGIEWISRRADIAAKCYICRESGIQLAGRDWLVTGLQSLEIDGDKMWQIDFQVSRDWDGKSRPRDGWLVLAPKQNWAIKSFETHYSGAQGGARVFRGWFEYDSANDGIPVPREFFRESLDSSGQVVWERTSTITNLKFSSVPETEFAPQAFGLKPEQLTDPTPPPCFMRVAAGGAALSLLGGPLLLCFSLRRTRKQERSERRL